MSAAKIGSERTIQLLLDWKSPDGERVDVAKAVKVSMLVDSRGRVVPDGGGIINRNIPTGRCYS